MNILQLQQSAQEVDEEMPRFWMKDPYDVVWTGKWLDPYFGHFRWDNQIPNTFISVRQWIEEKGLDDYRFLPN